jgi:hypothetical protein
VDSGLLGMLPLSSGASAAAACAADGAATGLRPGESPALSWPCAPLSCGTCTPQTLRQLGMCSRLLGAACSSTQGVKTSRCHAEGTHGHPVLKMRLAAVSAVRDSSMQQGAFLL